VAVQKPLAIWKSLEVEVLGSMLFTGIRLAKTTGERIGAAYSKTFLTLDVYLFLNTVCELDT